MCLVPDTVSPYRNCEAGRCRLSCRVGRIGPANLLTAQTDFEQVARLAPHAEEGHSALGTVLIYRGRTKEGIRELETALAIRPTDTNARMNLAIAYQQIGSSAKAIQLFAELEENARLQKRPMSVPVLSAYARALAATGKLTRRRSSWKAASSIRPS